MKTSASCKVSEAQGIHDSMNIPKIEFISQLGSKFLVLTHFYEKTNRLSTLRANDRKLIVVEMVVILQNGNDGKRIGLIV